MKLRITRPLASLSAVLLVGLVAGCAQPPTQQHSGRASTLTDAQEKARGQRDGSKNKGTSQVAIGFGDKGNMAHTTDLPKGGIREIYEAKTFLGTISCAATQVNCSPIQFTVTLSPSGAWRMRATEASTATVKAAVAQGCWHQIGTEPTRILLETMQETVLADLSFVHDQQLRVNVFNYVTPTLETHLSRQQDIDGIDELQNQTGPICRS